MVMLIGFFIVLGGIVGAMVIGVSTKVLSDEFKAWAPRWTERIINCAVAIAPSELRERLSEEWRAWIAAVPGDLSKLFVAIGFLWTARQIPTAQNPAVWRFRIRIEFSEPGRQRIGRPSFSQIVIAAWIILPWIGWAALMSGQINLNWFGLLYLVNHSLASLFVMILLLGELEGRNARRTRPAGMLPRLNQEK